MSSVVLQHFISLSSLDPSVRIKSTEVIINILTKAESSVTDGHSEMMIYALDRLVKGISSSQDCARQGYMLCLIHLLKTFPTVDTTTIMETAKATLVSVGGRQQNRDILFGRLSVCLVLIASQRITTTDVLEYVVKNLFSISTKKEYFSQIVAESIIEVIKTVPKSLHSALINCLNEHFPSFVNLSPLDITIICYCDLVQFPISMPEGLNIDNLISDDSYSLLQRCCKSACSISATSVPPLLLSLVRYAQRHKVLRELINGVLAPVMHGDHCFYSIVMGLCVLIPTLSAEDLEAILLPSLIKAFCARAFDRKSSLRKVIIHFLRVLTNSQHSAVILRSLTGESGSIYFDKLSSTKTISHLVTSLGVDDLTSFVNGVISIFSSGGKREWLLEILVSSVVSPSCPTELFNNVLTLIFAVSFGYDHPSMSAKASISEARQRMLQLILHSTEKEFTPVVLEHFHILHNFHKQRVEFPTSLEAVLKKCGKYSYYEILLLFLSLEWDDGDDAQSILVDATIAIDSLIKNSKDDDAFSVLMDVLLSLLSRPESQPRTIVNIVWKNVVPIVGNRIKQVTNALVSTEESFVIEDMSEDEETTNNQTNVEEEQPMEEDNEKEIGINELLATNSMQQMILNDKKQKEDNKKKAQSAEQKQVQLQYRICELIETYCKTVCDQKEFINFFPDLLETCGYFFSKSRFASTYNRLLSLIENTSKLAPIIKDADDEFVKESFVKIRDYMHKQRISDAAQKLLGYYLKYIQKGSPLLATEVKAYLIQQLERCFKRKKSMSFKVIETTARRSESIGDSEFINALMSGVFSTTNTYLKCQGLDLAYGLIRKNSPKMDFMIVFDMLDNNIVQWVKMVCSHLEQAYALKFFKVVQTLVRLLPEKKRDIKPVYSQVTTILDENIVNVPKKLNATKKAMSDLNALVKVNLQPTKKVKKN
ncbi:Uncharacterized protein QTN25_007245 [Entamoeba marina]